MKTEIIASDNNLALVVGLDDDHLFKSILEHCIIKNKKFIRFEYEIQMESDIGKKI